MTEFRRSKKLHPCALNKSSLSNERIIFVNTILYRDVTGDLQEMPALDYLIWELIQLCSQVYLDKVVGINDTFDNNWRIRNNFTKHFEESCCWCSDQHFSIKCFPICAVSIPSEIPYQIQMPF